MGFGASGPSDQARFAASWMRESLRHGLWLRACKGAEHRSAFTHPAKDLQDDRLPDMHTPNTAPQPCAQPRRREPRLAAGPRSTSTATTKVPSGWTHPANRLKDDRLTYMHTPKTAPQPRAHPRRRKPRLPAGPRNTRPEGVCMCVCCCACSMFAWGKHGHGFGFAVL